MTALYGLRDSFDPIAHPERLAQSVHPCPRRTRAWRYIEAAIGLAAIAIIIGCGLMLVVGFGVSWR